jgi:hypothetical protein
MRQSHAQAGCISSIDTPNSLDCRHNPGLSHCLTVSVVAGAGRRTTALIRAPRWLEAGKAYE